MRSSTHKPDLFQLLDSLDPECDQVHRNLWLMQLLGWIRGDGRLPEQAAGRVELLLDALQCRPDRTEKMQRMWAAMAYSVDASIVLSDYGLPCAVRLSASYLIACSENGCRFRRTRPMAESCLHNYSHRPQIRFG